jgi:hypothetical protein
MKYKGLVTVKEYAKSEGIDLDDKQARRYGQMVLEAYKMKHGNTRRPPVVTRGQNKSKGYDIAIDRDILEACLMDLLEASKPPEALQLAQ